MSEEERSPIYAVFVIACLAVLAVTFMGAVNNHDGIVELRANQDMPCACEKQLPTLTKRIEAHE